MYINKISKERKERKERKEKKRKKKKNEEEKIPHAIDENIFMTSGIYIGVTKSISVF